MGMSMKLKQSTVEDVKARFEFLKEKKKQEKKEYSLSERLEDAKEEEEKMQAYTQQVRLKIDQNKISKNLNLGEKRSER